MARNNIFNSKPVSFLHYILRVILPSKGATTHIQIFLKYVFHTRSIVYVQRETFFKSKRMQYEHTFIQI